MFIIIIICLTCTAVSAQDLNNSDINSIIIENKEFDLTNVYYNTVIGASNEGTININIKDSYVDVNRTWVEEGIATDKAQVTIYDNSNSKVF